MKKTIFLFPVVLLLININAFNVNAGTFTSLVSGAWNNSANWSYSSDADGIPDYDDDVMILAGHTMSVPTTSFGNNITIDGTVNINSGGILYIRGDYALNGTETGAGAIGFTYNPSAVISGNGVFGTSVRYSFSASKTIAAGTVINKAFNTAMSIASNATLTNNGTFSIGQVSAGTNSTILNTSTGTLFIRSSTHVSSTLIIDAQATGNTVNYSFSNASGLMKSPLNGIFHHLVISGATTKSLQTSVTVNGNFVAQSGCGFNFRNLNMNVKGNFVMGSSLYTQQTGSILTLDGTSAQNFVCTGAAVTNIPNLVINNPAGVNTTGGIIRIANYLEVQAGNFNAGSNYITLLSNATSTARIAQSNGSISGSMIIERFVAAQPDGWTTMSSPVTNATFAQWEDDFALGFGPYIPRMSEPSAYGYNETAWDYFAIENNTYPINPGEGYEVYLASDYSVSTPMVATVAELIGTPNMGDITYNVTVDNDGWNLLGNPYASFIDWETFRNNCGVSLSSEFMYYDESINDYSIGYIGDEIAQSEGLWVEALAPGTITFHESDKTSNNSSAYRNSKEVLFALKVSTELTKLKSHTYFRLDENAENKYIQGPDQSFLKLPDPKAPALYTHSSEGKKLRVNELLSEDRMSIPVSFKAGINGEYQIEMQNFDIIETDGYKNAILEDKQTGMTFNLKNGPYTFKAETQNASGRFTLHLSKEMETSNETDVKFIPESNGIWIHHESILGNVSVKMLNPLGQEISGSVIENANDGKVYMGIPESYSGIYIIQVITGDKMVSKQFYKN